MGAAIRKRRPDVRKGAIYEGLVATRCGSNNNGNGTTKFMMRSSHKAVVDIKKLKVAFGNYRVPAPSSGAETGIAAITVTASIEYPTGVFCQLLFNGQVSGSIPSTSLMETDYATPALMIPIGATFWIRTFQQSASAMNYSDGTIAGGMAENLALGDLFNYSSPTPTDQTMGGTITDEGLGNFYLPPAAIIGVTNAPSVIAVGDSITAGLNEATGINDGRAGLICKGFPANTLAFLNHGSASATASTGALSYLSWSVNRRKLWKYASHFIEFLGFNDLFVSPFNSAAQAMSDKQINIWAQFPARARILLATITPNSTSSDAWATAGNQTTNAHNAARVTLDTTIRSGVAGAVGFFETAWALENTHDDGKWLTDGSANKYTADGVHPNAAGNTLGSAAIDMTKIFYP